MYVLILKDLSTEMIVAIVLGSIGLILYAFVSKFSDFLSHIIKKAIEDFFKKHDNDVKEARLNLQEESGKFANQLSHFSNALKNKTQFLNSNDSDTLKVLDELNSNIKELNSSLESKLGKINELLNKMYEMQNPTIRNKELLSTNKIDEFQIDNLNEDMPIALFTNCDKEKIQRAVSDFKESLSEKPQKHCETLEDQIVSNNYSGISVESYLWLIGWCYTGGPRNRKSLKAEELAKAMFGFVPSQLLENGEDLKNYRNCNSKPIEQIVDHHNKQLRKNYS